MRRRGVALIAAAAAVAALWVGNSPRLAPGEMTGRPELLAHRGVAQRFHGTGLRADTCTAARMLPPRHGFLENTLPSIAAGFAAGADVVEIDVHPTTDGDWAVFHDWTLDCRTDGTGVTREHSMPELRRLDVGHGYTADGGRTFPFRGRGVGLMPSLGEVLETFPDGRFLINVKSDDPREGEALAGFLARLPPERQALLMAYGGERPMEALRARLPDLRTTSREALAACLGRYLATGWTGRVPRACERRLVLVPVNVAPWLWGWPDRFLARMRGAGSAVFLLGPWHGGAFSTGLDTPEDLARVPPRYDGGIMTDEIEAVGRAFGRGGAAED